MSLGKMSIGWHIGCCMQDTDKGRYRKRLRNKFPRHHSKRKTLRTHRQGK